MVLRAPLAGGEVRHGLGRDPGGDVQIKQRAGHGGEPWARGHNHAFGHDLLATGGRHHHALTILHEPDHLCVRLDRSAATLSERPGGLDAACSEQHAHVGLVESLHVSGKDVLGETLPQRIGTEAFMRGASLSIHGLQISEGVVLRAPGRNEIGGNAAGLRHKFLACESLQLFPLTERIGHHVHIDLFGVCEAVNPPVAVRRAPRVAGLELVEESARRPPVRDARGGPTAHDAAAHYDDVERRGGG
mmetsp:Transcript_92780/g.266783  ORF Transcript_92780/g.266783 Transcript_92780/m.266783 type:complete len:246 (-) Transcript_92780:161-898(-)